jgi:hypothetical protein
MLWRLTFHETWKLSSSVSTTRVRSVCPLSFSSLSEMFDANAWLSAQSRLRASTIWILHACNHKRVRSSLQACYMHFMAALTKRFPWTRHKWHSDQFNILRVCALSWNSYASRILKVYLEVTLSYFPWKLRWVWRCELMSINHETHSVFSCGVNIFTFVEWNKNKW